MIGALEAYPVRSQYRSDSASQLVQRPVSALLTVSADATTLLNDLGITSIFDLGASLLFDTARRIVEAASPANGRSADFIGADFLDQAHRGKTPADLADASAAVLRQVDTPIAGRLTTTLGISTIRELAGWPAYRSARAIINDAYGLTPSIVNDFERPDDLIPIARRYATERVQYDVLVMDRVLEPTATTPPTRREEELLSALRAELPEAVHSIITAAARRAELQAEPVPDRSLELTTAGGIDVSDLVAASLMAKPALGAVLTYRQSWFPQGLALGHLLHSMALAPGESTRMAMVDWTRTVRARTSEDTTQTEALAASIERTRAMSEVTNAVATEAQSGFSGMQSTSYQAQAGISAGAAGIIPIPGVLGVGAMGASASGSIASTNATGWTSSSGQRSLNAEMSQNITDRTHQASNSVRNRRATAIMETSQQESETLTTRVVTNYNHMHALTMQYFEVVQVYRVVVELVRKSQCLFVPMRLVTFTPEVLNRYRAVIGAAGLTPEVRALSGVKTSSLLIRAPQQATWDATSLALASKTLGDSIGSSNQPAINLPLQKLKLSAISVLYPVNTAFEWANVYSRNGGSYSAQFVLEGFPEGPTWVKADLKAFLELRDLGAIVIRRKEGQEDFSGTYQIMLSFDVIGSDDEISLRTNMIIPKNTVELTVFTFAQAFVDADVIDHLEQNALYYSTAIWRSLDAATITTLLSTYKFNGQPLIQMIDPVPVTVTGNYVVFRFYGAERQWQEFLTRHNLEAPFSSEDLIPLPSGGVFAEAVLGRSNSAEKLDISRFWNWQDSPIPILPPEINPLSAGGKSEGVTLNTGNLESPVVNITTAPPLPDPAGLAPLYTAIANGNMFRDMSGMAQIAALAGTTMAAAQTGAGQAGAAAGAAQQVAAKLFTDVLQMAIQAALAAGLPPSALAAALPAIAGGRGGGGVVGGAGALPQTPTNLGAALDAARKLDQADAAANPEAEWAPYPGGSTGDPLLSPPPLLNAPEGGRPAAPLQQRRQDQVLGTIDPKIGTGSSSQTSTGWEPTEQDFALSYPGMIAYLPAAWESSRDLALWNFEVDSADLQRFDEVLTRFGAYWQDWKDRGFDVEIVGAASISGSALKNQEISYARAVAAKQMYEQRFGMPTNKISVRAVGASVTPPPEDVLARFGDNELTWRAWNRRVEFHATAELWDNAAFDRVIQFLNSANSPVRSQQERDRSVQLAQLLKAGADDRYLIGFQALYRDVYAFWKTEAPSADRSTVNQWLLEPAQWNRFTFLGRMRMDLARAIQASQTDALLADRVLGALRNMQQAWVDLDNYITIQSSGGEGAAIHIVVRRVYKWIGEQSQNSNSIYSVMAP